MEPRRQLDVNDAIIPATCAAELVLHVMYTTPPVRRRGGTRRLGSGLHTLRPGLCCIRLHQLGGGGTRRLGSGLHTLRPGLYCIRLHQLGGGGTRRLGSGLHTLRPGLCCIRLHQLGGGGTWRLGSDLHTLRQGLQPREETPVAHTTVFTDRRMSMDRKVLLYWSTFQRTAPNRPLCGHNESPHRWSSPLHSNRPPVKK